MIEQTILYKETEFIDSSIGRVPSDWDTRELGDESIASIIAGQSPPSSTYSKENQGLPFLQGKTEFGDIFPSPTVYCSKPIKVAKKDDVLLSVRAPVGDVNIAPFECCIGRGLAAVRTRKDRLSHMFLFHYLRLEGKRFKALSTGSTFKAIRMQEIEKFQVPLPPVPEQVAIVEVLGVVDSAIELADKVILKTERLKKGLMQKLLTEGIGHKEFKDTEIGKIPDEWQVVTLQEICEVTDGSHWSPKETEKSSYKIATVANLKETRVDIDSCKSISETDYLRLVKEGDIPKQGDILFSKDGTVGICFAFDQHANNIGLLSSIAIIKPDRTMLLPEFGGYALKSPEVLRQVIGWKTGTALRRITIEHLKIVEVPIPSLSEQQKIAGILSSFDEKLELERSEKAKLERVKRGLMDLLLTGKVRVRMD